MSQLAQFERPRINKLQRRFLLHSRVGSRWGNDTIKRDVLCSTLTAVGQGGTEGALLYSVFSLG